MSDLLALLDTVAPVLGSGLRMATPLLFACLAGLWSERSGVVDIGLEGKMLAAAFAAGAAAATFHSASAGLVAAIGVAVALSLVHGFASISQRGNQIVSGMAINFLAAGLTVVLGGVWFGQNGRTPQLEAGERFLAPTVDLGIGRALGPGFGRLWDELVACQAPLVWVALLAVPLTWFVLARTRFGLELRAVGDDPRAVASAGVSVAGLRWRAVVICGVLCGFAGTYLAIAQSAGFTRDMTAGKGFIALAALVFAKWKPFNALGACLLFGLLDAVAIRLQGVALPGVGQVSVQAIQALPYLATVILLAGFIGRAVPPKASGEPWPPLRRG